MAADTRARLQIRIRQTGEALFVVEVWRLERRKLRELRMREQWAKISETPVLPQSEIDKQFGRAFHDYRGDFSSMVWEFDGLRELPAYPDQIAEEFRKSKKRKTRGAVH